MKKQSKRYKELLKSVVKDKKIELKEIIDLVKKIQQQNLMSLLMYL